MRMKLNLKLNYFQDFSPQLGRDTPPSKSRLNEEVFNDGNGIIEGGSTTAPSSLVESVEEEDVADQLTAGHVLGNVTSRTTTKTCLGNFKQ